MGQQRAADGGRRPGDEQPDAVAVRLGGDAAEHVGGRGIQERHRGEIDHKTLALVGDAVEHVSDCRGGTEEERAGDAVDQHVAIDGERGIVRHALAIAVIGTIGGHQRGALLDARHLRHAVDEQHRAEREPDQDAFGQVAEDGEQEGASSTTASPQDERKSVANSCFSAMVQATTTSTAASAASGM